MFSHRRAGALLVGALSFSLALAGCAGKTSSSDADGADDGPITIACGAMEDLCKAWTDAFTEKTGIPATYVRLSSGETVARLASAKDNPEFDVWHGGPVDGYGEAVNQGLIESYSSPEAAAIPDKYKDPDGNWTGVYVGVLGFCSNKSRLDALGVQAPDSWDDLLDPALKGQISTAHPSTSGTAFTTLWTQVTRLGSEDAGLDYMQRMHSNVLQYTKSGTAPGQIAGRGEAAVGLVFSHDCVKYQEEGMSDLTVSFPSEGTGYEVGAVSVLAGARNPEGAKAYMDWLLTTKAQDLYADVPSFAAPTLPDAKVGPNVPKQDVVKHVDWDVRKAADSRANYISIFESQIAGASSAK